MTGPVGGQFSGGMVPPGVTAREPFGDWSYDAIRSHVDTLKADPISSRARAWQALGSALAQQEQSLQDDISKVIGNGWSGVGAVAARAGVGNYARDGGESATTVQAIGGKVAESGESIAQTVSQFPARVDDGVTGVSSLLQGIGHFVGLGAGPAGPGGWHQGLVSAHNQELNAARDAARRVMTTVYQPGVAASDNGVPALTKPVDPTTGGPDGAGGPFGGGAGPSGGSTGGATSFGSLPSSGGGAPGADGSATGGGSPEGQVHGAGGANPLSGNGPGSRDGAGATGGTGLGSGQSAGPAATSTAGLAAPSADGAGAAGGYGGVGSGLGGGAGASGVGGIGGGGFGSVGGGLGSLGGVAVPIGPGGGAGGSASATWAASRAGVSGAQPGRAASSTHSTMPRGGHTGEDEDEEYRPASYLVTIDNGNELIGELPKVVPPVIGA